MKHYKLLNEYDQNNCKTKASYVGFLLKYNKLDEADIVISGIDHNTNEYHWLQANFLFKKEKYYKALTIINNVIEQEPWNIGAIVLASICWVKILPMNRQSSDLLVFLSHFAFNNQQQYDLVETSIKEYLKTRNFELGYLLCKLAFIHNPQHDNNWQQIFLTAKQYDLSNVIKDFIKLLNTGINDQKVKYYIGLLYKEQWNLEVSNIWLNLSLNTKPITSHIQNDTYLQLADCLAWQNKDLNRSYEYLKMCYQLSSSNKDYIHIVMIHVLIKMGNSTKAWNLIKKLTKNGFWHHDMDFCYLHGLFLYRNGKKEQAKTIWKPLIKKTTHNIRQHIIKQEVINYYFNNKSYLKVS